MSVPARQDLVTIENNAMRVNYHPGQDLALDSLATETYIIAGLQSGKTTFLPHWLRREMKRCGPGNRTLVYLCIGPTFAVLGNKAMPEFRRIFEDITGWGRFYQTPKARIEINKKGEREIWGHEQKEPTSIYFCYADDPTSFAGFTALAAVGDEIGQPRFKRSAYVELKGRLSVARGQVAPANKDVGMPGDLKMGRFMGGSIVYGLNWIYELRKHWINSMKEARKNLSPVEFQNHLRRGLVHPLFHFIRFDSTLNPSFPQVEFDLAKATMEEWYFNMRYRGIFTRPAGLIYGAWKTEYEIPEASCWPIPPTWMHAAAFDPGDVNFYGLIAAQDPIPILNTNFNKWLIYDLYHDAEKSFEERGQEISSCYPNLAWSIVGQISEERWRNQLRRGGLSCEAPPVKDFWMGINSGVAAMRLGLINAVYERCGDLLDDFGTFSRPIDEATGAVLFNQKPEDEVTRHYMAAFRYFCIKAFLTLGSYGGAAVAGSAKESQQEDGPRKAQRPSAQVQTRRGPVTSATVLSSMIEQPILSRGYGGMGGGDPFLD